jgi:cell division protein FtsI/penicillin-binding protein 2
MPKKHEQLGSVKLTSRNSSVAKPRQTKTSHSHGRNRLVLGALYLLFFAIIARLFYWQVLHRSVLQAEAEGQYTRVVPVTAKRGKIYTQDGYLLVGNQTLYRLFAQPYIMKDDPNQLAQQLTPYLMDTVQSSSASASPAPTIDDIKQAVTTKLNDKESHWVVLKNKLDEAAKEHIDAMHIHGLGFENYDVRQYPEASLAAQIVGFVGKDKAGADQGYFGIEGGLDRELRGYAKSKVLFKDALGFHLLFGNTEENDQIDGRTVVLSIRRDIQHSVEELLKKGIEKYQAVSGEVIVMDPATGKILAMASFPNYDPSQYFLYDHAFYKNPSVADSYEPGSTFKVLTVAAGIDSNAIKEDTVCTECASARQINQYTIKTWNDQYHPNITIKDALAKSDNVAMIFVAEHIGQEKFIDYIKKFGIGEETKIELQEDTTPALRKDWKQIDLATSSFGQGIAATGLQMVRAVGAIANKGALMRPSLIDKVIDPAKGTEVKIEPVTERQVVSPETAETVAKMMAYAADTGEAKWTNSKTHIAAGKTGTAQIPIDGHYDSTKTIASFIGFAPLDKPRFVMLVKLREPKTSPWAAETAAPLWYQIADKLFLLLNVPPDR